MKKRSLQSVRTYPVPMLRIQSAAILFCLMLCCCAPESAGTVGTAGPAQKQAPEAFAGSASKDADPEISTAGTERAADDAATDPDLKTDAPVSGTEAPEIESVRTEAERLSGKYSVQILCGGDVPLQYADYTAACLDDPGKIAAALKELDRTLSIYPPGFFTAVEEGYCESITICLAKDLHAISDTCIESAYAFTTVRNDTIWLVLNADEPLRSGTLIHELTHVIDYRLLGMNQIQESEWNLLNPPSFSYYNAYLDESGADLRISGSREYTAIAEKDPDRIWFCDPYSKTFAMEDRARLMEKLLKDVVKSSEEEHTAAARTGGNGTGTGGRSLPSSKSGTDETAAAENCFSSPHIQTKLRFYFYTLRQAFENTRWPEETVWEAALRKAAP